VSTKTLVEAIFQDSDSEQSTERTISGGKKLFPIGSRNSSLPPRSVWSKYERISGRNRAQSVCLTSFAFYWHSLCWSRFI
jgi:hypothetical protein